MTTMNNNGNVVSFGSKLALFQRAKFRIPLFLWVKMKVERVMGIEPTSQAWEAHVLPLYDTRVWKNQFLQRVKSDATVYQLAILVSSRTRFDISAFLILVVFFNPKFSQQKLAVTLPQIIPSRRFLSTLPFWLAR